MLLTLILIVIILLLYIFFIRPWQLKWGATDEEIRRTMPGDAIVKKPIFNATRAITVNAHPEHIWPWILQIGCKRAGWYSYDWIDNLGIPSAKKIIPEYQHIEVDQLIPMSPNGKLGLYVKGFEKNKWVLWGDKKEEVTWLWAFEQKDNDRYTRLITRVRMKYNWLSPSIIFNLLLDVGDIIMMRKSMLGIKARAEMLFTNDKYLGVKLPSDYPYTR